MASSRLVECQDCGNRWDSSADSPRCAKSDCGRSRNVEPVDDTVEDEPAADAADLDDDQGHEPDPDDLDDDLDDEDDSGGYTPAFETQTNRVDAEPSRSAASTPTADSDGDRNDEAEQVDPDDEDDDEGDEAEQPTPDVPDIDPEQLQTAMAATFDTVAVSRGEHWQLEDDEAEQLAEAWAPVLDHYAPAMLQEHALLVAAAITSYGVLSPRLAEDKRRQQLEDKATDDATGTVRDSTVDPADAAAGLDLDIPTDDEPSDNQTDADTDAAMGGYASV